jgi:hypothetical protein
MCAIPVGDKLAEFTQANAAHFGVTYIIHNSRIWNISRQAEGWRVYNGTNPHTDHVHVSFQTRAPGTTGPIPATPSNGGGTTTEPALSIPIVPGLPGVHVPGTSGGGISIPNPLDAAKSTYDALKGIASVLEFLVNPKNWVRMLMFFAGLILILIALGAAERATQAGKAAVNALGNVGAPGAPKSSWKTMPTTDGLGNIIEGA